MSEREGARQVLDALRLAADKPSPEALPILNGLIPLVQGGGAQGLEAEEARASAFLAICEVGKALHRAQHVDASMPRRSMRPNGGWGWCGKHFVIASQRVGRMPPDDRLREAILHLCHSGTMRRCDK